MKRFLLFLFTLGLIANDAVAQTLTTEQKQVLVREVSLSINKNLPQNVDNKTMLLMTHPAGETLVYKYQIQIRKIDIPKDFYFNQKSKLIENWCASAAISTGIFSRGLSMMALYVDLDDSHVAEFKVSKADCDLKKSENFRTNPNSLFRNVKVSNLISIDVPTNWTVKDENERKNVAASAEAMTGQPTHVANLSVTSTPEPSGGIIRVSIINNAGLSQEIFQAELRRNRVGMLKELQEEFNDEFKSFGSLLQKQNMKLLSGPLIEIISLDRKNGFTVTYRRSGLNNSSFLVIQHHVPLKKDKALITLSFREQDRVVFEPILEKVKTSIRILQ